MTDFADYLMEWNVMCRICLQEGEMLSVYDKDESNITFCEKIMYCASVEIKIGQNLPELICSRCVEDLSTAYRFRSVCESSNAILQSYQSIEKASIEDTSVIIPGENGSYQCKLLPQDIKIKKVTTKKSTSYRKPALTKTSTQELQEILTDAIEPEEETDIKVIKIEPEHDEYEDQYDVTNEPEYLDEDEEEHYLTIDQEEETEVGPNLQTEIELATAELGTLPSGMYIKSSDFPVDTIVNLAHVRIKKEISENGEEYYELTEDIIDQGPTESEDRPEPTNIEEEQAPKKRGRKSKKSDSDKTARPHMCEICGNTYRFRFNLEAHTRRHTGEKPFTCSLCEKGFVIAFELRRHMRCHTGVKPYQCKYCDRKFSDFGSRIKHQRSHTGERPYVCAVCGKSFAYSHVLSSHNLIHTGVKKYGCDACGKRFTKSHHLKAHLNVHLRASPNNKTKIKQEPVEIIIPQN